MHELSVLIPAYSEATNLKVLLPQLINTLSGICQSYEIIVCDSPLSNDCTADVCREFGCRHLLQTGKGYADAIRCGISEASGIFTLVLDADLSQDISVIPAMLSKSRKGYDIVIGSRYVKYGVTEDPFVSVLMSKLLNTTYRLVLHLKPKDISTDFRIYDTSKLKQIETFSDNYEVIEEILFKMSTAFPELKICEIPVHYRRRSAGSSKRRLAAFIRSYIRLLIKLKTL